MLSLKQQQAQMAESSSHSKAIQTSASANAELGGCQNYGPFLGTLNIRCRIIIGILNRTIILTSTQLSSILFGDTMAPNIE